MSTELPNIHPYTRLTTPTDERMDIDTEMVPLVQTLWGMELATLACCQDIGESAAGLRDPERTTRSGHGGFVEFYRGYAWLKMPLDDGLRLLNTMLRTSFHDRVTVRWMPGSWRMHVPLVHDKKSGIGLAYAAQLYFPRKQITELNAILMHFVGIRSRVIDVNPRGRWG